VAPSELLRLLKSHGIRPRRSLGQHFLTSARHLDRIVDLAELGPQDAVLEVGAGTGLLTARLAERAGVVVAVEVDPRLVKVLEASVGTHPRVRVVPADIMALQLRDLFPAGMRRKVVANLPYRIASPLLVRLLEEVPDLERLVVTVQEEVARRLAAPPGSAEYGLLSVLVRFHADVRVAFRIPPGAFLPPPQVTSAVVLLRPRPRPADVDYGLFRSLARAAFGQRRKQLHRAWAALGAAVQEAARVAGVDLRRRGETLTVEEFAAVARVLSREPGAAGPRPQGEVGGVPDSSRRRRA
jgi:16S rRNA (adenine1518-N6/adenine1519-N6)-dimethyltransferase